MAGLTGKTITSSYKSLLRVADDANGIGTSVIVVTDGEGTNSCLQLGDDQIIIYPQNDSTSNTFVVRETGGGGANMFIVNTSAGIVRVNAGLEIANTQYASFGVTSIDSAGYAANTHQAIPFSGIGHADLTYPPAFGTGTDPATTFTTAHGNGTKASDLIPCIWFIPDDISIASVTSIEGADTATGETTGMHLFEYTFNSGSTSALTAGSLVAHSTPLVNAGSEQGYKTTWTVDSEDIDAGKVILAFFEPVSTVNSDYSINITIKYYLR